MRRTIVLISCVKRKLGQSAKAKDIYDSTLFRAQRTYAEKFADEWWILSSKHGLLHPDTEIELYEQTLKNARRGLINCPSWAKGSNAPRDVQIAELAIEELVSQHIGKMEVLSLNIPDEPGPGSLRGYIERNHRHLGRHRRQS